MKLEETISKEHLQMLSDEELKELKHILYNSYDSVREFIRFKNVEPYKKNGQFVKITDFSPECVTYMHVRSTSVDSERPGYSDSDPCVTYTGHAFSSEFSDYADMNYLEWTTWKSVSILLRNLEDGDETRKRLGKRTEENKDDYDRYSVVEITKDEFMSEFNKMIERVKSDFPDWIEFDENESKSSSDINNNK